MSPWAKANVAPVAAADLRMWAVALTFYWPHSDRKGTNVGAVVSVVVAIDAEEAQRIAVSCTKIPDETEKVTALSLDCTDFMAANFGLTQTGGIAKTATK